VRAVLGRAAVPRVLRTVDALPLRGIGKPDRAAVARLLAASSLAAGAPTSTVPSAATTASPAGGGPQAHSAG
jgi:o-succinylbenzoate---CoA ligase